MVSATLRVGVVGLCAVACAVGPPAAAAAAGGSGSSTALFVCVNGPQYWTVPPGVFSVVVDAYGGQGGGDQGLGGLGGEAAATVAVAPGQVLQVNVGCAAAHEISGFGGGGLGGSTTRGRGYAGGGASDVRDGGYALTDR